jgi:plasmid stabilization system protein ParE
MTAIQSAVNNMAAHPLVGRLLEGELRELIISYGHPGYVALSRFVVARDEVTILAIRHQREVGFRFSLFLAQKKWRRGWDSNPRKRR